MHTPLPVAHDRRAPVGVWLWCLAALVVAMVAVGGATRLTQSGLSIVEWKPVTGVIPPLGEADWQAEFAKYRTIPQFAQLNSGMTLAEFKGIFWWEWGHRLLGRLIGVVFLLPFLWFLWRGRVDRRLAAALAGIFGLGAVQGAVGWWMVASGLTERVSVSQYRLAFHLTLACIIYVALAWTADLTLRGDGKSGARVPRRTAWTAMGLLVLTLAQIYLGALVAGQHAGLIYNTWPLIEGRFVPPAADLFFNDPWWRNLFENAMTVQFDHRMTAYLLCLVSLVHLVDVRRSAPGSSAATGALAVTAAIFVQAALGIVTLMNVVPLGLALAHQMTALVVLTAVTLHARRTTAARTAARDASGVRPDVAFSQTTGGLSGRHR